MHLCLKCLFLFYHNLATLISHCQATKVTKKILNKNDRNIMWKKFDLSRLGSGYQGFRLLFRLGGSGVAITCVVIRGRGISFGLSCQRSGSISEVIHTEIRSRISISGRFGSYGQCSGQGHFIKHKNPNRGIRSIKMISRSLF